MKSLIVMLSFSLCTLGALRLGFAEDAAPAAPAAKESCPVKADGKCAKEACDKDAKAKGDCAKDKKECGKCCLKDKSDKGGACAKDANSACAKGCAKDGKDTAKTADGKPAAECAKGCSCCCATKDASAKAGEGKADCKKACETKPAAST